jgi:ABC-type sugar transport system substrate-binding protein
MYLMTNNDRPLNLAMFTKNRENPAYSAARMGADRVAARLNARVTHYVPVVPDSVTEQQAFVDQAITNRPTSRCSLSSTGWWAASGYVTPDRTT